MVSTHFKNYGNQIGNHLPKACFWKTSTTTLSFVQTSNQITIYPTPPPKKNRIPPSNHKNLGNLRSPKISTARFFQTLPPPPPPTSAVDIAETSAAVKDAEASASSMAPRMGPQRCRSWGCFRGRWSFNRDPYNGSLKSPHTWVGFHPRKKP